jgi:pyrroline-5-carboxylate reductase
MKIAIVGVGNLGSVLAQSLLAHGVPREDIILVARNKSKHDEIHEVVGCRPVDLPRLSDKDILIIAVKPQDMGDACDSIRHSLSSETVVLSVMAGVSCGALEERLNHRAIARAMPNLGARVRESATAFFLPNSLTAAQVDIVEKVIMSCGRGWRVDREELVDVATAVAGSGPAYICWLAEQMEIVARDSGIAPGDAHALVLQTLKGAVSYLEHDGATFAELRARVTSPNGTTAAALATLEESSAHTIVRDAVRAAIHRAIELGRQ